MKIPRLPKFLSIYFIAPAIPILSRVNTKIDFSTFLEKAIHNWQEISRTFIYDFLDWINMTHPYKDSEIDGIFFSIFMFTLGINCILREQVHFISSTRRLYVSKSRRGRLFLLSSISLLLASYYIVFLISDALPVPVGDEHILTFAFAILGLLIIVYPISWIGIYALISPFFVNQKGVFIDEYLLFWSTTKAGHIAAFLFFCSTQCVIILTFVFADMVSIENSSTEYTEYTGYIVGLLFTVLLSICFVLMVNWKVLRQPLIWAVVIVASDRIVMILDPFITYVMGVILNHV